MDLSSVQPSSSHCARLHGTTRHARGCNMCLGGKGGFGCTGSVQSGREGFDLCPCLVEGACYVSDLGLQAVNLDLA